MHIQISTGQLYLFIFLKIYVSQTELIFFLLKLPLHANITNYWNDTYDPNLEIWDYLWLPLPHVFFSNKSMNPVNSTS